MTLSFQMHLENKKKQKKRFCKRIVESRKYLFKRYKMIRRQIYLSFQRRLMKIGRFCRQDNSSNKRKEMSNISKEIRRARLHIR